MQHVILVAHSQHSCSGARIMWTTRAFSQMSSFTAQNWVTVRKTLFGHHKDTIKLLKINEVEEYRDEQD